MADIEKTAMEIEERLGAIKGLAAMSQTTLNAAQITEGSANYVILQYELVSRDPSGKEVNRSNVSDAVQKTNPRLYLGGSAYAYSVHDGEAPQARAAWIWALLYMNTTGKLLPGDVFILHYPNPATGRLGFVAQCVPAGAEALSFPEPPTP